MDFTVREIEDRLEEAALTLRRVPHPPGSGPKGYGSSWPEYVREARHAYGYHEARMKVVPSAREIERMEEALGWLAFLPNPDDRRLVWMRAEQYRWRSVCNRIGVSRSTAWRRWSAGLLTIAKTLKAKGKPRRKPAAVKSGADKGAVKPAAGGGETLL